VLDIVSKLVGPFARQLPQSHLSWIPTPRLVAILAVLLACFLGGLLARATFAQGVVGWLERMLLSHIPGYTYMKTMGATLVGAEGGREYKAVIARIEDSWQMGFLVEYVPGGHSAVFVPGTPSPWSGSVYFMTEDRFRILDVPLAAAMGCVKRFGAGAQPMLRGKADWNG
jgi:uncharacterized membrane protein